MSPRFLPTDYNRNIDRVVIYQFRIKHRGEVPKPFLEGLKHLIWEYFGDVGKGDIMWKRVNNTRGSGD